MAQTLSDHFDSVKKDSFKCANDQYYAPKKMLGTKIIIDPHSNFINKLAAVESPYVILSIMNSLMAISHGYFGDGVFLKSLTSPYLKVSIIFQKKYFSSH